MVDQSEEGHLVDDQSLEAVVENGELDDKSETRQAYVGEEEETYTLQPQGGFGNSIVVQQETGKQQTEKHDQTANEVGHSTVAEHNANEQADVSGGKIEQDQHQHEFEEFRPRGDQSSHRIHNDTHDDGRDQSKWNNIKHHLGRKVGDRVVVAIGALTNEQKSLSGEHRETSKSAEPKQGQDEEEQTKAVLEALDVVGQTIEEIPRKNSQEDRNGIMGEHQHRVPVEIAPCALGQNDKLPSQTHTSQTLGLGYRRAGNKV